LISGCKLGSVRLTHPCPYTLLFVTYDVVIIVIMC